jgi:hypothetical protein
MIASGVASTGGLAAMALKKLGAKHASDGQRQDAPDERRATSSLPPGSS